MDVVSGPLPPDPLAEKAQDLLTQAGFDTRTQVLANQADVLLAENDYAVAAVLSAKSWKDVSGRLPDLQVAVANWAADRDAGAKQWDLYLILLLSDVLDDSELSSATDLTSDLRFVRKIVRAGVKPENAEIRKALAPLLPLEPPTRGELLSPMEELERRLPAHGLTPAMVESALAEFLAAEKGSSDDRSDLG